MSDFKTKVQGQDVICRVTHYKPYVPPRNMGGAMEDAEESMDSEFEFELHYPTMGRATGLELCISMSEIDRLQDEYEAHVTAIKHGLDF